MRGWQIFPDNRGQSDPEFQFDVRAAKRFKDEAFQLRYIEGHFDSIPVPGDFERLTGRIAYFGRADGTLANMEGAFGSAAPIPLTGLVRVSTTLPALTFPDPTVVPPEYTNVDGSSTISPRVRRLAEATVKGIQGDDKKAEAIRLAIAKRAVYDVSAPATPAGRDPVDFFLFDSKRGYCDLFASAMVVMCRAVNIPARLVNGYAPFTEPQPHQGFYTIYQTDYHMWGEVYFKDVGWMVYDPTDDAEAVPGHGRGASNAETAWYDNRGVQIVGIVMGFGVTAAFVFYAFAAFRRSLRFNRAKRTNLDDLERAYVDFVRTVEARTGKPMRPSDTPDEYLAAVRGYLDGSYGAIENATHSFVRTYYSTMEPTDNAVNEVRTAIKEAKIALKNIKRTSE